MWARVFDFGDGRGDWIFLTARNGSGVPQFSTNTINNNLNVQSVTGNAPLPTNQWVHLAVTFSDRLATLYVNGVAVGSNANMDFPPYQINGGMPNSWIGRSQFSSDPYLNGKVDDFRIYRGAMTAGQLYTLATGSQPAAVPAAPASLGAAAVPGNQINLSWSAVSSAATYSVYRSATSGGPYTPVATLLSGTSYSDMGLSADTPYYYVVAAANTGGEGAFSTQATATALPPLPGVPTALIARGMNASTVALNWTAGANDYTYTVRRSTTVGGPYTTIATGVSSTTFSDTTVTGGTTYYYVVAGDNAASESANSNEVSVKPAAFFADLLFDDGTGTTAADATGNGWTGTLVNGATWTTGKSGGAVNLASSSSQYVTLPNGVLCTLTSFTFAAWVNPTTLTNWARIFDIGTGTSNYTFLTAQANTGKPRFAINNGSGEQDINSSAALPLNTWSHIAITISGGVGSMYLNGSLVGTNSSMTLTPASLGVTTNNYIGRSEWASDPYFNGSIDDLRLYDIALTSTQVASLAALTNPLPALPSAPTSLTAGVTSPTSVLLNWTAGANDSTYTIRRATSSTGPYAIIASSVSGTSYTDSLAGTGTTYYYTVAGDNVAGESATMAV